MSFFAPRRSNPVARHGKPMLESLETRTLLNGDPPTANPDLDATDEATFRDIDVVGNDTDPEDDVLTVSAFDASSTLGATISLNANGTLHYDPSGSSILDALAAGEQATDTFSYTISDGASPATSTVTVTVTGLNDAPTAVVDAGATNEDAATTIDVVFNDTDPDVDGSTPDDVLVVSTFDATSILGAGISLNGNGTLSYDPTSSSILNALAAGETVDDTFSYTVSDGNGGTSTATVTITVTGLNDAPTAVADPASTDEDTAIDIAVVTNDTDPDVDGSAPDDVLAVSTFDAVSANGAAISLNADGTLRYDPTGSTVLDALAVGATTSDTFSYTVSDGNGGTSTATVTVTVSGVNDGPTAVADTATVGEDGPAQSIDLTTNDTDPDTGDDLEIQSVDTTGTLGTVTINADNDSITYDPNGQFEQLNAGQTATDTFSYTVSDGNGGVSTTTVTITITGQNDPAVFTSANTASVAENTTAVLTVSATDPEGDPLTYSLSGGADQARFAIDPTSGALTFVTAPNFEAPTDANTDNQYVVIVAASDGTNTSTQTITVTVTNVNEAPLNTAPTAEQQVFRNGTLVFRAANGNALRVADIDAGTSAITVELRVTSGRLKLGGSTTGLTVTGDNTGVVTITGSQTAISTALEGTSFKPVAGFTGVVTLTMTTNDQGNTGTGTPLQDVDTVTIRVGNRKPTVLARTAYHAMFVSRPALVRRLNVPASLGLLTHVTDADGDSLRIKLLSGPRTANGTPVGSLVVGPNGAFSYSPPFGFAGRVTFTYRVSDGLAWSDPITVTIDVLLPVAAWQRRGLPA